ncbi:hypothetical protein C8R44DRAFT_653378, partial [Mycena epipterygia]
MTTPCPTCKLSGRPRRNPAQTALVRELLRSHRQLGPGQLPSLLSSLSDQLRQYDEKIAELEGELQQMAVDRTALQSEYNDSRSLLAPVRRLPSEILAEIFAEACRSNSGICPPVEEQSLLESFTIERLANHSLLTLSQVCARWHSIAICTPLFW